MFPTTDRFSRSISRVEDEMDDLMGRCWGGEGGWLTTRPSFMPTVDLVENENQFEVSVDLPGLKPEEVTVEMKDGDLWISGKREEEKEEKGKTFHRTERHYGEFRRVLPMPSAIKETEINAKFDSGVLKIVVPKSEEVKPKQIEVTA